MNDQARKLLAFVIHHYGVDIIQTPKQLQALLKDHAKGQFKPEISLFMQAVTEGLVANLVANQQLPVQSLSARAIKHLQQDCFIEKQAAHWVIDSWCIALKLARPIPIHTTPAPVAQTKPLPVAVIKSPVPPPTPVVQATPSPIPVSQGQVLHQKQGKLHRYNRNQLFFLYLFFLVILYTIWNKQDVTQSETPTTASTLKTTEQGNTVQSSTEKLKEPPEQKNQKAELLGEPSQAQIASQSDTQKQGVWTADWSNDIVGLVTTEPCHLPEFTNQGYVYALSSSIPLARLKHNSDAWQITDDRATTVLGCWFKKDVNNTDLIHAKFKRKKDDKIWETDLNLADSSWTFKRETLTVASMLKTTEQGDAVQNSTEKLKELSEQKNQKAELLEEPSQAQIASQPETQTQGIWTADWDNDIIGSVTTEPCHLPELTNQGYVYALSSSIPLARLKHNSDAWRIIGDRATTVLGCWFKKDTNNTGLIHAKFKRKKDDKIWEDDLNLADGSWTFKRID